MIDSYEEEISIILVTGWPLNPLGSYITVDYDDNVVLSLKNEIFLLASHQYLSYCKNLDDHKKDIQGKYQHHKIILHL